MREWGFKGRDAIPGMWFQRRKGVPEDWVPWDGGGFKLGVQLAEGVLVEGRYNRIVGGVFSFQGREGVLA